jgi:DNA-binding PadR family transcriptional regulator
MLETLARFELITVNVVGLPLQANLVQRKFYHISRRGLEFLEAYRKIQDLITYLGAEEGRQVVQHKEKSGFPMDFVDGAHV